ncbi:uncharacterized protein YciI [Enterococcus sp. PF1-24]|uniref:YciI family protein n=1 Tax=unclassified Enterococcus TaxID=2608891 RepID=UPI002476980D|nr:MULTISPECIES: YciI family protein [unclassified Enterococcus]MDH6364149.1 uncharacterized protein YciI [Enterococcus sp. PFB1-1]MDH6401250.1 uncharacterized protein YciI [Enterococcus sp. PF1-24]
MKLKEGSTLYIRIDYKIEDKQETEQDGQDCMAYLQSIAKERYLMAGLLGNMETEHIDGAMLLFEAKDLAEAQEIANNDPIIQRGFYRCEVKQLNIMLVSDSSKQ